MTIVKPIREGYETITTSFVASDDDEAIEFYKDAFGANGGPCLRTAEDKSITHVQMRLGDSAIMMG